MSQPKVSHCANPKCDAEFKRLGEGKLFVRAINPKANANRSGQKAIWLCDTCAQNFEVKFDRTHQAYKVVELERIA